MARGRADQRLTHGTPLTLAFLVILCMTTGRAGDTPSPGSLLETSPPAAAQPAPLLTGETLPETVSPTTTTTTESEKDDDDDDVPEPAEPTLALPSLFRDHMVLQRGRPIPVWGWAHPGLRISVTLGEDTVTTKARRDGTFLATLPSRDAGGPHRLVVVGDRELAVSDVLIGDVWLCSGDMGMEATVAMRREGGVPPLPPDVRFFDVGTAFLSDPADDVSGSWKHAAPEAAPALPALPHAFAARLREVTKVPLGIITAALADSRLESWMSLDEIFLTRGMEPEIRQLHRYLDLQERIETAETLLLWTLTYQRLEMLERDPAWLRHHADPALDDSAWARIRVPSRWEDSGYPGLDGEAWYRTTVRIPESWEGRDLELRLGPIDDCDTTFFDGHFVDSRGGMKPLVTRYWHVPRVYRIPGRLVRPGDRVLSVRVADQGGAGGIAGGDPEELFLAPADTFNVAERVPLAGEWRFKPTVTLPIRPNASHPRHVPTLLYNGMIAGLTRAPLRGVVWFLEGPNLGPAYARRDRLTALIGDWRRHWRDAELPFLLVGLPSGNSGALTCEDSRRAVYRDGQRHAASIIGAGVAPAMDTGIGGSMTGEELDAVAARLVLLARRLAYAEKMALPAACTGANAEGARLRLRFDGPVSLQDTPGMFFVAGTDRIFHPARASWKDGAVFLSSDAVPRPVEARYAWTDAPGGCALHSNGMPLLPFRTDTWPLITEPPRSP